MNSGFLIVLFSAAVVTALPTIRSVDDIIAKAQQDGLVLVGLHGQKIFFRTSEEAYNETNWMAAPQICQSAGLEIAKIDDSDEFRWLYNYIPHPLNLWVGGHVKGLHANEERGTEISFEWDDGSEVTGVRGHFYQFPEQWLCLYFSKSDHLYTASCLNGRYRTLCQTTVE